MTSDPVYLLAVLCLSIAVSEWLSRHTPLRHLGTSLLVIVLVAVLANAGAVPTFEREPAFYGVLFDQVVYVGLFWLLLTVRLSALRRAGPAMVGLFAAGAAGTAAGVVTAYHLVDAPARIGDLAHAVGGMFTATYVGGSANLNAVAAQYAVREGRIYVGVNAVDAIMTVVWMAATIAVPRALERWRPRAPVRGAPGPSSSPDVRATGVADDDGERITPSGLALLLFLGGAAYVASGRLTEWLSAALSTPERAVSVPFAVVITTLALALAHVPAVARLRGARLLGTWAVYLFLAGIGALCDLGALQDLERLAGVLFAFVAIVLAVHGAVVFGTAALFRLDWAAAGVASQANVGGGSTALALARSLSRTDLALPGILVGALGTASGTYLGILVAELLAP